MTIQWYPGHMAKAKRQVMEKLKLIDVVIELLDARLPFSSQNPMMDELVKDKPRLVLLNKKDLADPSVTEKWLRFFDKKAFQALAVDAQSGNGIKAIPSACQTLARDIMKKMTDKGMKPRPIRALIVGIPNVGKSSLINRLAKRHVAKTGDRPGVTKAQQWIKTGHGLELLDTPGILWPKFDDPLVGLKLAASGAIRDEILPKEEVALFAIDFLRRVYPERLKNRYSLQGLTGTNVEIMEAIGRKRGCLKAGASVDYERISDIILNDLRSGKLGPISFETPEAVNKSHTVV
ncbi:ribosome biogenesis GTPase A [Caldalkalibacillus thermarum]|uniref:ribosome biogenesis GTPase YlqF n=1 Tax=Caldalkalibacillus thermarum TaxID=296745 RepID=UPI00166346CE|nr:ribosome biogenesis GTPase YlqF [Caldalkalibacillus thermarum]GGK14397.1 ribosome biogenesis GTPase A [Caldalkalibacillus thermarum]